MEAALLRFVIYFFALANFACSLEHAKRTRSCAQFPTHMQLFCYRVEKFWGSIAFPDPRNTVEDVQEVDRNKVVVGNVVQNNKLKDTGKLRYVEQTFKRISKWSGRGIRISIIINIIINNENLYRTSYSHIMFTQGT